MRQEVNQALNDLIENEVAAGAGEVAFDSAALKRLGLKAGGTIELKKLCGALGL